MIMKGLIVIVLLVALTIPFSSVYADSPNNAIPTYPCTITKATYASGFVSWQTETGLSGQEGDPLVLPSQWVDVYVRANVICPLVNYGTVQINQLTMKVIVSGGGIYPEDHLVFTPAKPQIWYVTIRITVAQTTVIQRIQMNVTNAAPY